MKEGRMYFVLVAVVLVIALFAAYQAFLHNGEEERPVVVQAAQEEYSPMEDIKEAALAWLDAYSMTTIPKEEYLAQISTLSTEKYNEIIKLTFLYNMQWTDENEIFREAEVFMNNGLELDLSISNIKTQVNGSKAYFSAIAVFHYTETEAAYEVQVALAYSEGEWKVDDVRRVIY